MKKISALMLVFMMSFSLLACGKESDMEAVTESAVEETLAEAASTELSEAPADVTDASGEDGQATASEAASKEASDDQASAKESTTEEKKEEKATGSASEGASEAGEKASAESSSDAQSETAAGKEQPEVAAAEKTPERVGYGRKIFTGDSRTVDMFSGDVSEISGSVYNDITVFCKDGAQYDDMVSYINGYGIDNFDTLITWMGCNDFGNFSQYGPYYDSLIAQGKQIVVCTVGPTQDEYLLDDMDWYYYPNSNQVKYNNSLVSWANSKGVKVIDLYSYISNSSSITVVPTDGIHYLPQPTIELWNVIQGSLK